MRWTPFKHWLRTLTAAKNTSPLRRPRHHGLSAQPRLEWLEDRINPAPVLTVTKGVAASDSPTAAFSPNPPAAAPITFTAPGSAGTRFSGGTINNAYFTANPTTLNSNVTGVDNNDTMTFVIVVRNTGDQGAFDVRLRDTLANGFARTGVGTQGVNLRVTDGAGNAVAITGVDLFGSNGIELVDDVNGRLDSASADAAGTDVVVISYDLRIQNIFDVFTIDTFNAPTQNLIINPPGGTLNQSITGTAADIVSLERDSHIQTINLGAGGGGNLRIDNANSNILTFSLDSQTAGQAILQWDGADNSPNLVANGLANRDFTAGGADRFIVNVLSSDLGVSMTLRVLTTNGTQSASVTRSPAAAGAEALTFLFSDFTTINPAINFTQVGSVELTIDPPAEGDVAIDQVVLGAPRLPCDLDNTASLFNAALANFGPNIITTPLTDTATVSTGTTLAKTLTSTEITDTNNNTANEATIGERATYTISFRIPEGVHGPVTITDTLSSGLAYVPGSVVLGTVPGGVTVGNSPPLVTVAGQAVTFDLGTINNTNNNAAIETITLTYQVQVLNVGGNTQGAALSGTAVYSDQCGARPGVTAGTSISVVEPSLGITKTTSTPTLDPGQTATYTITLSNTSGRPTSFDTTVSDTLPSQLTGLTLDSVVNNSNPGGPTLANFTISAGVLSTATPFTLLGGGNVVLTVSGTVAAGTTPGTFSNNASGTGTTLSGNPGQRIPGVATSTERGTTANNPTPAVVTVTGDYGDAPNSYATTFASNGARHVRTGPFLGATTPDGEADGPAGGNGTQDDATGTDDEDGFNPGSVTFTQGTTVTLTLNVGSSTVGQLLYGFIDWNRDGDFADAVEAVLNGVAVVVGNNSFNITVPGTASVGASYARFRISTQAGLSFNGLASDGEVEDYPITFVQGFDFGDLPAPYATLLGSNGPRHQLGSSLRLGTAATDAEGDGQPDATATGDDTAGSTPDDEDGVTVVGGSVTQGAAGSIQVVLSGSAGNARLYGFIDWNNDGDFTDSGETVANGTGTFASLGNGTQTIAFTVPDTAVAGTRYMRWRVSTVASLTDVGLAADGEVEDHTLTVNQGLDFGDLPDGIGGAPSYATFLANNGPRHQLGTGLKLGTAIDSETDGQPNTAATGDGADEDGVTVVGGAVVVNQAGSIQVVIGGSSGNARLYGFIDWNNDGDFADAGEVVADGTGAFSGLGNGTVTVPVTPPAGAAPGTHYMRWRVATQAGLTSTGLASDGEVEDYTVLVLGVADLSLAKSISPASLTPGATATFTISVTNDLTSPQTATGVTVTDTLPAGLSNITQTSPTGTITVSGSTLTWSGLGSIAPGNSVTLTFTAAVNQAGSFSNYAQIATAGQFDPDSTPGNNSTTEDDDDTAPYTVQAVDLGDAPTAAQSGFASSYPTTLALNGARHIATGPTLGATRDSENDGQPNATATGDGGDEDGVTLGILTQNTANTITVNASAAGFVNAWIDFNRDGDWADAGEQVLTNAAVVTGNNSLSITPPLDASFNYVTYARFRLSSASVVSPGPTGLLPDGEVEDYQVTIRQVADLSLAKTATLASLNLGDTVTFTITMSNGGPNAATGVTVTDTLPAGLTNITKTSGPGTIAVSGSTLTWSGLGAIASGGNAVLTLTATVNQSGSFSNYAQVATANQFDPDSTPGNDSTTEDDDDSTPYTVLLTDFGDAPTAAQSGFAGSYPTALALNGARHVATGPTLGATRDGENDGQPNATATGDGADEDGVTLPNGAIVPGGYLIQGVNNTLTVNSSGVAFVSVWIDFNRDGDWGDAGERVANAQVVAAGNNSVTFAVPLNVSFNYITFARVRLSTSAASLASPTGLAADGEVEDYQVNVRQQADLSLTKSVNNTTPLVGDVVTFTMSLTNAGPNAATGVTVSDPLPVGLQYVAQTGGTGTYDGTTWTIGAVASGVTVQVTFTTLVSHSGIIRNFAQVATANQFDPDSTPNNGTPPAPAQDDEAVASLTATPVDMGDAPTAAQSGFANGYPTLLTDAGARHGAIGPTLGPTRDVETDGQPNATASGDGADEDGVTLVGTVTIGLTQTIVVNVAGGSGFLNAWIDFNRDGVWQAGEQVLTNAAVSTGSNTFVVPIPLTTQPGVTFARFRLTSASVASPLPAGSMPDGEVEDYLVNVQRLMDFGDAPNSYGTTLASSGAAHVATGVGPYLGAIQPDIESDGQPSAAANGDDSAGTDDEDGVTFGTLTQGAATSVTVSAPLGGRLDGFIDYNGDGDFLDTGERITPAGGFNLSPGSNTIPFTVPAGAVPGNTFARFRVSTAGNLGPTGFASDGEVEDYPTTILPGPATFGDRVWYDVNGNGVQDAGEPGFTGVGISALWAGFDGTFGDGDDQTFQTTTGANGVYTFPNRLPGNYRVTVDPATLPGNVAATFDVDGSPDGTGNFVLSPSQDRFDVDFGYTGTLSLGDRVWYDANNNAVQDAGEIGLTGVGVSLTWAGQDGNFGTADDLAFSATTTGANGIYGFSRLVSGNYRVTVSSGTLPNGVATPTFDFDGTGTAHVATVNSLTASRTDVDFGYVGTLTLGDRVWHDADNDGTQDAGEPGLSGVTVTVTWAGQDGVLNNADDYTFPTTTTAANGIYGFAGLATGTHRVTVTNGSLPNGINLPTFDLDGIATPGMATVASFTASRTDVDFGYRGTLSLGDRVWYDVNANGLQDAGEPGLMGVTVNLRGAGQDITFGTSDDLTQATTSGANGVYAFPNLGSGSYTVSVDPATLPAGMAATFDLDGIATPHTATVNNLTVSRLDVDFGYTGTSSLSGFVYVDFDNDGIFDAGETPIAGVAVTLMGTNDLGVTINVTLTTGFNGVYSFQNMRPSNALGYTLSETQPPPFNDGKDTAGNLGGNATMNDIISAIPITVGQNGTNYNFGERGVSLSGRVFIDLGANGVRDPEDPALGGVLITLKDAGGNVVATTLTNANDGTYSFDNLSAGNYTLVETQPNGYGSSTPNVLAVTLPLTGLTNQNFGETTSSLFGVVYFDTNNNGVPNAGEPPILGAVVRLTGTDVYGVAVTRTSSTRADGAYGFTGLVAGIYTVTETQPPGFADGLDAVGTAGGTLGNDMVSGVQLGAAVNATGYNFGERGTVLSGVVFIDDNTNGIRDAGEAGLGGVPLTLLDANYNVVTVILSNPDGTYLFSNLPPGIFTVIETQPAGFGSSTPNTLVVNVPAGGLTNQNFGETTPAPSVAGVVYVDLNNDGIKQANEPGIPGAVVTLTGTDANGGLVNRATTTAADGSYSFAGLTPSNPAGYKLTETQPTGYADGLDAVGSAGGVLANDMISNIPLPSGGRATGYNFGERGAALSGTVYLDTNGDGVRGPGETTGLGGVVVTLQDGNGNPVASTTTAADGSYSFLNLAPGNYRVVETQPADFGSSTPNTLSVSVPPASLTNQDFGETTTSSLAGVVYLDVNNDGIRQLGEPGIAGVTITLTGTDTNGNPVNRTATTAADGSYLFASLPASNATGYTVTETQPAAFTDGIDSVGSAGGTLANDSVSGIILGTTVNATNYIFGERSTTVSGTVFIDNNRNGGRDPGDAGLGGVLVTLLDARSNVVASTTAAADGSYLFIGVMPGAYSIVETQPNGYGSSTPNTLNVTVPAGGLTNQNFGETVGSLSGFVFADLNNDGIRNGADFGLAGVVVTLTGLDANGVVVNRVQTTAADGSFDQGHLLSGTYTLTESQPVGFFDGKDTLGTSGGTAGNDVFSNIVLGPSGNGANYRFGEIPVADPIGSVYIDRNGNGVRDPGEPGIPGVSILLTGTNVFGSAVSVAQTTDANGLFLFNGLVPGIYNIRETQQPAGFLDGAEQNGNPPAAVIVNDEFRGIDLTQRPFFGFGYHFGEFSVSTPIGSFPPAIVVPPVSAETVFPTFVSKQQLLASSTLLGFTLYVNSLYRQVLARPADVGGVNYWVYQLTVGAPRQAVANGFWESPEHRGLQVDRFYQLFLRRPSDAGGRGYFISLFQAGLTETDIAERFLASPEYQSTHPDAGSFVTGLYLDVLGRAPDLNGLQGWQIQLQNGVSRTAVARAFLTSPENDTKVIDRYFAEYLGRAPDEAGRQAFLAGLQDRRLNLTSLAEIIFASVEYFARQR